MTNLVSASARSANWNVATGTALAEWVRCLTKAGGLCPPYWRQERSMGCPVPRDRRLHADDPRLDAVWDKCAELKMPVSLHVADHPSCWRPLGPTQERTPDFQHFNLY